MTWRETRRDLNYAVGLLRRKPFNCLIQVTNRCNMHCSFCSFWSNSVPPNEELTLPDFRHLAGQLSQLGTLLVSLEGGEPFLRPDLVEIVRLFGRCHLPVLYTNGWFVEEGLARDLFAAGLAQVGVSIDYPVADRHDAKRGLPGAFERAQRAVHLFWEAAPHGGRQVHVMTVLMKDNQHDLEALLQMSADLGVGHCLTLLSQKSCRRGPVALNQLPDPPLSVRLLDLWRRYPHLRLFRRYLEYMDPFLSGGRMPVCRAGRQSCNIDHQGRVSPCIERIDCPVGDVRRESMAVILARLRKVQEVSACQDCWTMCRGYAQLLSDGGSLSAWRDLGGRMRSV